MRVLSASTIFPSNEDPGPGVFIKQRLAGLPDDVDCKVVRLRPWFPGLKLIKPTSGGSYPASEIVDGLEVHDREFFYLPGLLKDRDGDFLARGLEAYLDSQFEQPDLLDAHFAFPTGYGAVKIGRARNIPVCITLRGTLGSYATDSRRPKLKEALLGGDRIIAVSSSLANLAEEIAEKPLDVRVIGNGIDTEQFQPRPRSEARAQLGLDGAGPVLLTVGGLVPRKGVHRVLELLPSIVSKHPEIRYVVVGGSSVEGDFESKLQAMIKELKLENVVRLEGAVAHDQLAAYYSAADLFCLPTANEGWANALQESLACGTPVVTTDVGGNLEVVGSEKHGLVVPFGDPKALEHAILDALAHQWPHAEIARVGQTS